MKKTSATLLVVGIASACTGVNCLNLFPKPSDATEQPDPESQPGSDGNTSITTAACSLLAERVGTNQDRFQVFENADSGFNHGFPSGFFGDSTATLAKVGIEAACIDDPDSVDGCSNDMGRLDHDRGTALRVSFDPLLPGEFVGVNIEEPENWGASPRGQGYDLAGATAVVFDGPGSCQRHHNL